VFSEKRFQAAGQAKLTAVPDKVQEVFRSITIYEPGTEPSPEEEEKEMQEHFSRIQKRIEELEKSLVNQPTNRHSF